MRKCTKSNVLLVMPLLWYTTTTTATGAINDTVSFPSTSTGPRLSRSLLMESSERRVETYTLVINYLYATRCLYTTYRLPPPPLLLLLRFLPPPLPPLLLLLLLLLLTLLLDTNTTTTTTMVALAPRHVCIDGRERVIHDINVRIRVRRPGYRNPLLLSSGKVDALLPDLGRISGGQLAQILLSSSRSSRQRRARRGALMSCMAVVA